MRVVCISDTHSKHHQVNIPGGDLLIHAGDFTRHGSFEECRDFIKWFLNLSHRHKVLVAGNHDYFFQRLPSVAREMTGEAIYLENEATEIEGIKIWGSPVTPNFLNMAFNADGETRKALWSNIPKDTDILITHGPPQGIGDKVTGLARLIRLIRPHVGCPILRQQVEKIQPKLHVFGHIHERYGQTKSGETVFVNASLLDQRYRPVNPAVVIDLD